jgi:hypothetical protein
MRDLLPPLPREMRGEAAVFQSGQPVVKGWGGQPVGAVDSRQSMVVETADGLAGRHHGEGDDWRR